MSQELIYMNLGLVAATIVAFIFFTARAKAKASADYMEKKKQKLRERFRFYFENVLTRKSFRRIVESYSSLSCYDVDTVRCQSVQLFERNIIIVVTVPIVTLIIMKDTALAILMAFMSLVYYQSVIEKEMDKIYVTLMEECSLVISSIREKYLETDNIALAVLYADKSKYLEIPMSKIYRILTDVDAEDLLADFQKSYPVRIIKTLANTCYIVHENGAVKGEDGSDSFSNDMTILRQECDSEIRRLTKQNIAFKSLEMLSLVGLIIMPIAEWYLLSQIPGTAVLIKGFYGTVMHALIIGATIYAYYYITTANRPSVVSTVDKISAIDHISKQKVVSRQVDKIYPKTQKVQDKISGLLRDAISSKDYRYIYTAKPIFAVCAMIVMTIILAFGTITVRDNFYNNYGSLSFIPQNLSETQLNQIRRMDDKFMETPQEEYALMEDQDLTMLIKSSISGCSDAVASDQVKRLRTKYETYHNAKYHWWYLIVIYLAGCVAWFGPEFSLSTRKKMVAYEATDDIMQLQTMMIVLSETKMDVYKAICWLEKQASVHKAILRDCHYSYIAGPEKALDELEQKSPSNDFKRLIRKLKASVYTLSLHDAFSDMALDKAQSLTIREMLRGEELEQRKNNAKLIAIAPAALALVGCFIGPVIILGVSEMMATFESLGGLTG